MLRESAERRLHPRPWDTDWLLLRRLTAAIEVALDGIVRSGVTVLDLGAGSRPYERLVVNRGGTYLGADLDPDAQVPIGVTGVVPLAAGSADVVLSIQVLEHVADVAGYLREAERLVTPSGRLLLSTHGAWLYHPHPEDHRRWTRQGLIAELAAGGFQTDSVVAILGPLAWTTILRSTGLAWVLRRVPVVGPPVAGFAALVLNAWAWLEDKITPNAITADNACVYLVSARPRAGSAVVS